jgi:hypothetical protein
MEVLLQKVTVDSTDQLPPTSYPSIQQGDGIPSYSSRLQVVACMNINTKNTVSI